VTAAYWLTFDLTAYIEEPFRAIQWKIGKFAFPFGTQLEIMGKISSPTIIALISAATHLPLSEHNIQLLVELKTFYSEIDEFTDIIFAKEQTLHLN
jgi:hypothetical protein